MECALKLLLLAVIVFAAGGLVTFAVRFSEKITKSGWPKRRRCVLYNEWRKEFYGYTYKDHHVYTKKLSQAYRYTQREAEDIAETWPVTVLKVIT